MKDGLILGLNRREKIRNKQFHTGKSCPKDKREQSLAHNTPCYRRCNWEEDRYNKDKGALDLPSPRFRAIKEVCGRTRCIRVRNTPWLPGTTEESHKVHQANHFYKHTAEQNRKGCTDLEKLLAEEFSHSTTFLYI